MAIEYAVRHPERVTHLVLHGGFSLGWAKRSPESRRAGQLWRSSFDWVGVRNRRIPANVCRAAGAAATEDRSPVSELQRRTTTPEVAANIMEASGRSTSRTAGAGAVPTLVLHIRAATSWFTSTRAGGSRRAFPVRALSSWTEPITC